MTPTTMSSSSKFARKRGLGQFGLPQKRGIVPFHQGAPAQNKLSKGHGKDTVESVSAAGKGGTANTSQEESHQLLAHPGGTTQPFAMMIRLTPVILEELKQAEMEGITPVMKFGANASGHVIQVGHENFKFSSASEPGDLCDIYEERIDESGQQMLIEAGSVWRKLSVLRILSAIEKDRVKKRTAEAEKKQRLRKSILVDPSTQMILPQAAPAEVNGKKPLPKLSKEPPPKKCLVTMSPVPSAPTSLLQENAISLIENHQIAPPASPSPEPVSTAVMGTSLSETGALHCSKGQPIIRGGSSGLSINKGAFIQKDNVQTTTVNAGTEGGKTGSKFKMTNLRNLLITLLQENPKGMTMKAVEKAVAEGMPINPERKLIDKVIKSIASYHTPGKYLLNPGVEKGTFVEVAVADSERAQETSWTRTGEEEPSAGLIREAIDQKEINQELPNISSYHSHDFSVKELSLQSVDSQVDYLKKIQENSPKQRASDTKAVSSEGSDSSSSSESGSESDSESDTSGSGSASSASESGSGSDSDASSSSRDTSMDEDVDIMSDDENENKLDTKKQRLKMKEVKSMVKEDKKAQEDFKAKDEIQSRSSDKCKPSSEEQPRGRFKACPTSEHVGMGEKDGMDDNLLESVLGSDEDAVWLNTVVPIDAGLRVPSELNHTSSKLRKNAKIGSPKSRQMIPKEQREVVPQKPDDNQEQRKRNSFEQSSLLSDVDARAVNMVKQLDILVNKICEEKDEENCSIRDNQSGLDLQKDSKSPSRILGSARRKETEQHSLKSKARGINHLHLDKKEHNMSVVSEDNLSSRNLSLTLEASKAKLECSPTRAKDKLQKIGRSPIEESSVKLHIKQHSSMEANRLKGTDRREIHGKDADNYDTEKASEVATRGKIPEDISKVSVRAATTSKDTDRLHEGDRIVRSPDRYVKDTRIERLDFSGKDDDGPVKERVNESSTCKLTKSGGVLGRPTKVVEAQQWQKKDGGGKKANLHRFTKDLEQSGGSDQDALQAARSKKGSVKASCSGSQELTERARSVEEQAERPLKDVDFSKRYKNFGGKDSLKEAELMGRPSLNGVPFSFPSEEGRRLETACMDSGCSSHSEHVDSRNSLHESDRMASQDLELGEFRGPRYENEPNEPKRPFSRSEDIKNKQPFEATSRAISKKRSMSPYIEKLQPVSRSLPEVARQSPTKLGNDSGQESGSGKRRLEDIENAETYKPHKKKLGADQVRPSQHEKGGLAKEKHRGKRRSSGLDVQEHGAGSSRYERETNKKQSNTLMGDIKASALSQKKESNAPPAKDGKRRDDHKAKHLQGSGKKQITQSSEVQGREFFSPYEKKDADLRGPIYSSEEFREYREEFNEKYPIYVQLNASLESDKEDFKIYWKDIEQARCRGDKVKLASIHKKVRKEYYLCRKRYKRMRHAFKVLHEELQAIKKHCKDYAKKSERG